MQISFRHYLIIIVALILVCSLYLLLTAVRYSAPSEVILLKPDYTIAKIKPAEPGGAEFLNMDKSVYDYISLVRKDHPKEYIMPGPEQAMIKLKDYASVFETDDSSDKVTSIFDMPEITVDSSDTNFNVIFINQADYRLRDINHNSNKQSANYKLHVYTAKTEQQAINIWHKIMKANSVIIGDNHHKIVKTDLGEKGIIYKIYIGPFSNFSNASNLCKKLIKNKQSCIVVNN